VCVWGGGCVAVRMWQGQHLERRRVQAGQEANDAQGKPPSPFTIFPLIHPVPQASLVPPPPPAPAPSAASHLLASLHTRAMPSGVHPICPDKPRTTMGSPRAHSIWNSLQAERSRKRGSAVQRRRLAVLGIDGLVCPDQAHQDASWDAPTTWPQEWLQGGGLMRAAGNASMVWCLRTPLTARYVRTAGGWGGSGSRAASTKSPGRRPARHTVAAPHHGHLGRQRRDPQAPGSHQAASARCHDASAGAAAAHLFAAVGRQPHFTLIQPLPNPPPLALWTGNAVPRRTSERFGVGVGMRTMYAMCCGYVPHRKGCSRHGLRSMACAEAPPGAVPQRKAQAASLLARRVRVKGWRWTGPPMPPLWPPPCLVAPAREAATQQIAGFPASCG
jgi:hypothetical protein